MSDGLNSSWWVVLVAAIPTGASGLWVFWRWWVERGDKREEGVLSHEQVLMRELEVQRAALSREHAELFDRVRAELARAQVRSAELERERDRGWDLARWWNRRAHELRHAGLNAQTMVTVLCSREELDEPAWPDMSVPGLEEPR